MPEKRWIFGVGQRNYYFTELLEEDKGLVTSEAWPVS
uniref:Uncharacterized protein n=1 Tax=Arundo donax TaxID=35708 RepID=A0A0A8XWQ7_ARUDO